jgi:tRNA pseudouridine55 synthase
VHEIRLVSYDWPLVALDLTCDKGLYVRRLARDLGVRLGTGGYCTRIHRTAVGPFTIDEARSLETLPDALAPDDLVSLDAALARL